MCDGGRADAQTAPGYRARRRLPGRPRRGPLCFPRWPREGPARIVEATEAEIVAASLSIAGRFLAGRMAISRRVSRSSNSPVGRNVSAISRASSRNSNLLGPRLSTAASSFMTKR